MSRAKTLNRRRFLEHSAIAGVSLLACPEVLFAADRAPALGPRTDAHPPVIGHQHVWAQLIRVDDDAAVTLGTLAGRSEVVPASKPPPTWTSANTGDESACFHLVHLSMNRPGSGTVSVAGRGEAGSSHESGVGAPGYRGLMHRRSRGLPRIRVPVSSAGIRAIRGSTSLGALIG